VDSPFPNHPDKALGFLAQVFNHSANWYTDPRFAGPLEPAWEIELTFADGTTRKQWGNPRLWNLYRGTSVGPHVLQSLLMASESWLLEYSKNYPKQLDSVLVDILRRSESVSLSAVVASVATAHPQLSGEALLVLLSHPDSIGFDLGRWVAERELAIMPEMFSGLQPKTRFTRWSERRLTACRIANKAWRMQSEDSNWGRLPHESRLFSIAIKLPCPRLRSRR